MLNPCAIFDGTLCALVFSGLGYIVGSTVASAINNQWQWGLRVGAL